MDKNQVLETLKEIKDNSGKRNFKQSIDLIITLKDLDLKNPEHQLNLFTQLHYSRGKKVSIAAFVGPELMEQAKAVCNEVISIDNFPKFKNKKDIKKLANKHEFFISQATIMPKVATVFGKYLGPKGKMPNPKAGCVVPPNANLKPLYEKLQKTIKVSNKNNLAVQCLVGKEDMSDEEVTDNILTIYNAVAHALPNEEHNIKALYLKLTMGKPFKVGEKVITNQEKVSAKKTPSKKAPTKDAVKEKPKKASKKENKEQK